MRNFARKFGFSGKRRCPESASETTGARMSPENIAGRIARGHLALKIFSDNNNLMNFGGPRFGGEKNFAA